MRRLFAPVVLATVLFGAPTLAEPEPIETSSEPVEVGARGLPRDEYARALADVAMRAATPDRAARALAAARCVDPSLPLPERADGADGAPGGACPVVVVSSAEGLASPGVEVRLARDPLGLVGGVVFELDDGETREAPLARDRPIAFVATEGTPVGVLVVLSGEANEIARIPVRPAAIPWLSVGAGLGAVAGLAVVTGGALGVAATYENPNLPELLRPSMFALVGAGALLAAGSALIAVFDPAQDDMARVP